MLSLLWRKQLIVLPMFVYSGDTCTSSSCITGPLPCEHPSSGCWFGHIRFANAVWTSLEGLTGKWAARTSLLAKTDIKDTVKVSVSDSGCNLQGISQKFLSLGRKISPNYLRCRTMWCKPRRCTPCIVPSPAFLKFFSSGGNAIFWRAIWKLL
jgi:hypothetical protein